jgi:hypothetical protein
LDFGENFHAVLKPMSSHNLPVFLCEERMWFRDDAPDTNPSSRDVIWLESSKRVFKPQIRDDRRRNVAEAPEREAPILQDRVGSDSRRLQRKLDRHAMFRSSRN